jgi:hypothetical protein
MLFILQKVMVQKIIRMTFNSFLCSYERTRFIELLHDGLTILEGWSLPGKLIYFFEGKIKCLSL